jgi:hypothetical protein
MPWMRTPEAAHGSYHCEPCTSAFPVERVGRLLRSRSISRLRTPFICIPACGLPVYASQWVLPPAHARLGTWLLARLCHGGHLRPLNNVRLKAQRSSNRTGPIRASGSRTRRHAVAHGRLRLSAVSWISPSFPCRTYAIHVDLLQRDQDSRVARQIGDEFTPSFSNEQRRRDRRRVANYTSLASPAPDRPEGRSVRCSKSHVQVGGAVCEDNLTFLSEATR